MHISDNPNDFRIQKYLVNMQELLDEIVVDNNEYFTLYNQLACDDDLNDTQRKRIEDINKRYANGVCWIQRKIKGKDLPFVH